MHYGKIVFGITLLCVASACRISNSNTKAITSTPPNIIFMIGDGMGLAQICLAQHAQDNLVFNQCTNIGFIKTNSSDDYITDSAAGATAFSIGQKTKNGAIGVDSNDVKVQTIMEWAIQNGWATGIIATCSITHATPASFFAHQPSRKMDSAIANDFYAQNIDVAIGGGKPYFNETRLKANGYSVITGTKAIEQTSYEKFVGFYNDSIHPPSIGQGRGDFLPIVTQKTLSVLSAKKKPFFLMIEGSQIDWGGHANDAQYIIEEMMDFNASIQKALDFLKNNPNTLIVITADHETGGLSLIADKKNQFVPTFSSGHHSGIMVPVFAFGKQAQLFNGIYENTAIYDKLMGVMR